MSLVDFFSYADGQQWQLEAACANEDNELFFPEDGESTLAAAKICAKCIVQDECLQFALKYCAVGVWGGMSARQRRMHKKDLKHHAEEQTDQGEDS